MNTRVNIEIAKLLDNKKYPYVFTTVGNVGRVPLNIPTIAEVVMWLYEKHGIWIITSFELNIETHKKEWFWVAVKNGEEIAYQYHDFNSPTEAYESAITYTLENLVKGGNK